MFAFRLASEYGLRLRFKQNFHELYESASKEPEMAKLLPRLGVISGDRGPMSAEEWEAAREYLKAISPLKKIYWIIILSFFTLQAFI